MTDATVRPRAQVIALYERAAAALRHSADLADREPQHLAATGAFGERRLEPARKQRARRAADVAAHHALRLRARAEADRRLATATSRAAQTDPGWRLDHAGLQDDAVAVIATDLDGTIRLWNHAAERLYGWPAAAVLGRPITEVTVGPDDADVAQSIMASIRRSGSWEGEFWVHRRDGTRVLAFVRDVQITDSQDRPVAIVGFSVELATEPAAPPNAGAAHTARSSPSA
jgi:PAS domain S-box-containing protein